MTRTPTVPHPRTIVPFARMGRPPVPHPLPCPAEPDPRPRGELTLLEARRPSPVPVVEAPAKIGRPLLDRHVEVYVALKTAGDAAALEAWVAEGERIALVRASHRF